MKTEIIIRSQFEALHSWPAAPPDVSFLRHPHRHVFHVRVGMEVHHNEREREFFLEKASLNRVLQTHLTHRETTDSCETMASFILMEMGADWVEVFEDGENGARVSL